jgi:hypothetical protein
MAARDSFSSSWPSSAGCETAISVAQQKLATDTLAGRKRRFIITASEVVKKPLLEESRVL